MPGFIIFFIFYFWWGFGRVLCFLGLGEIYYFIGFLFCFEKEHKVAYIGKERLKFVWGGKQYDQNIFKF